MTSFIRLQNEKRRGNHCPAYCRAVLKKNTKRKLEQVRGMESGSIAYTIDSFIRLTNALDVPFKQYTMKEKFLKRKEKHIQKIVDKQRILSCKHSVLMTKYAKEMEGIRAISKEIYDYLIERSKNLKNYPR